MKFKLIVLNNQPVLQYHAGGRKPAGEDELHLLSLLSQSADLLEQAGTRLAELIEKTKMTKKEAAEFQALYDRIYDMVENKIKGEG